MKGLVFFVVMASIVLATCGGEPRDCFASSATAIVFLDDTSKEIKLEKPAQRVVPLYGAFLEMLLYMGAKDKIVARTRADAVYEEVKKLPSVGTHMKPNIEIILSLKPDLVVQSLSRRAQLPEIERLEEAGIPVAIFHPTSFEEIFSTMERLAKACGILEEAQPKILELKERVSRVEEKTKNIERKPKVFFEVRYQPLTAAGRDSIVNDILTKAGLENVVKVEKPMVLFSLESLITSDPDYYIIQRGPMNENPPPPEERSHYKVLRAVKEKRIIWVNEFDFSRPSPRAVDALELIVKEIHSLH